MTSASRKKCVQASVVLVFLSLLFFVATPQSKVQAASRLPVERCAVLLIHLHGNRPATSTCLAWGKLVNGKMIPDTQTADCNDLGITLQIDSDYNGNVCFTGTGYLGIRLDSVYQIFTYSYGGWVLYYHGGPGYKYFLNSDSYYYCKNSPFCGYGVEITQVDVYNN
jgi:hypothetical protein